MDKEEMEETMTRVVVGAIWDAVFNIVSVLGLAVLIFASVDFIRTGDKYLLLIIGMILPLQIVNALKYIKKLNIRRWISNYE